MSLVSAERSVTQLAISFVIGAIISIGTTTFFASNTDLMVIGFSVPVPMVGLGISIGISIIFGIWAGRIRSNRVLCSIGHVILYTVFTFQLQNLIF